MSADSARMLQLLERVERAEAMLKDAVADLRDAMVKEFEAEPADRPVALTVGKPSEVTDAAAAQAAWIRLMGRKRRLELKEFYSLQRQLVAQAAALSAEERQKLRGDLDVQVGRLVGG